jgi:hypothetical protein
MDGDAREFVGGLRHQFAELEAPRIAASCDHLLAIPGTRTNIASLG